MRFTADDAQTLEQGDTSPEKTALLLQKAINDGSGWRLQGAYGRAMMQALEDGICMLGKSMTYDALGQEIPSRDQVKEGTKGSRQYVVAKTGEDWAVMLESIDTPKAKPAKP